jgi:hypothetical protein
MAADGAGGAYIVWVDGGSQWRLQRLRSDLTIPKPWPAAGLSLSPDRHANRIHPVLAPDRDEGVYVAWVEQAAGGDMSVWLLRVRADGRPAKGWPASGVPVAPDCPWATYPALVRLGDGVAVGWIEARDQNQRIRLAAFGPDGRPLARWPADGITLSPSGAYGDAVVLASGGGGGVFAAWTEMQGRLSDLQVSYASGASTVRRWTLVSQGVPPDATQLEQHPEIVPDGIGGAIVVWTDERSRERAMPRDLMDVFAQRISPSGQGAWTPTAQGSHPIAAGPWYQLDPHLVSDGKGGGFFSWNERGPGLTDSGRVQHLLADGGVAPGWPAQGIALGLEVSSLTPDLNGGVFAVWADSTGAYLQRFAALPSATGDAPVSLGPTAGRANVRITADARGGAFLAWEERKGSPTVSPNGAPTNVEVRVQHVIPGSSVSRITTLPDSDTPALAFGVRPTFPNPARTHCRIAFDLPGPTRVTIEAFDVAGRRVARLADGRFEAGAQTLSWNLDDRQGRRVPPGLYLVRVVAGKDQAVVRMTVTR